MSFSINQITKIVSILQKFYFILGIFILFGIPLAFFKNEGAWITFTFSAVLIFIFYFGLKNRKPWTVPLIIVTNSLGLIGLMLYQPEYMIEVFIKVFFLVLSIFELYFFTRKEVRKFFKAEGVFLFGR